MNARTIFLFALMLIPGRLLAQGIDSAQWPFPDTLNLSCALGGNYTYNYQGVDPNNTGRMIDSTWTTNEFLTVPEYPTSSIFLTWKDVKSIDSVGWHLGNQWSSMTLTFDSSNRDIAQLDFNYNNLNQSNTGESLSYSLYQLHYDQSNITCSDNDLWRHIRFGTYKMILGFTGDLTTVTFDGLDGFVFYGMRLIPGFSIPSTINFGFQSVDSIRDTMIVLHNLSDTALTIYSYELQDSDSGFLFIDTNAHFIAAQDSGAITVRFMPHETKMYSGSIHIVTDEPYAPAYFIQLFGSTVTSSVSTVSANSERMEILPAIANESATVSLPSNNGELTIYDVLGDEWYSAHDLTYSSLSIDTHFWPNGTYIVIYSRESGSIASKFVVQH
jgi:hypothetical protein